MVILKCRYFVHPEKFRAEIQPLDCTNFVQLTAFRGAAI